MGPDSRVGWTPVGPTGSGQYVRTIDLITDIQDLTAELRAWQKQRDKVRQRREKKRLRKKRRGW